MHAVLALGASHLSRLIPDGTEFARLSHMHQNLAIRGFQRALTKTPRVHGDLDALLGTCYALVFQATHMNDGLQDFWTMIRGCILIDHEITKEQAETAFHFGDEWRKRLTEPWLDQIPPIYPSILQEGQKSFKALEPLVCSKTDARLYNVLLDTLDNMMTSTRSGFETFGSIYTCCYEIDYIEFQSFLESTNSVSMLLQGHYIALQILIAPVIELLTPGRDLRFAETIMGITGWGQDIYEGLPEILKGHIKWPMKVLNGHRQALGCPQAASSWPFLDVVKDNSNGTICSGARPPSSSPQMQAI